MRFPPTCAILAAGFTASAQPAATFEWKGGIQANQTLKIRNVNGAIEAEAAPESDVEIPVHIDGTYPDPNSIHVNVVQHDGGILICSIYQGLSLPDDCTLEQTPSIYLTNNTIRVNYTVRVPADSPIAANTVNGQIVLSTSRAASASAVNGSILATLGNIDRAGSREFAVNGSIDIAAREQGHASDRASTVCTVTGSIHLRTWRPSSF